MQFISGSFIVFFLLAMTVFLLSFRWKRAALLIFNVAFYLFAGIKGAVIFGVFSVLTYSAGRVVQKYKNKCIFAILLIISVLPLLFYKYTGFIFKDVLGLDVYELKSLVAPLGISFFTFQGVGYLIDVYKGKCQAEKNFLNYFIFLSLFTCISSGPINRAEALLSQIREYEKTTFDYDRCVSGARYVLVGLFMKVFIAGCLVKVSPSDKSAIALLIGSICYTIEIFCDFCGYSYIAFGLSKILGITVVQNFDKPYSSHSITEFWRRWHISLSSWLRDYVYISLGGSRCSKLKSYFNTIVTFFVSGIWHGANWTFVVWGLLNGLIIVVEKITGFSRKSESKIIKCIKWVITLAVINTLWIFFDAKSIEDALLTIKTICVGTFSEIISIRSFGDIRSLIGEMGVTMPEFFRVVVALAAFFVYCILERKSEEPIELFDSKYTVTRWIKYYAVILLVLIVGVTGEAGAFIYANF